MESGRGACRVKLSKPAHGLVGGQRLYGHASLLQVLDHLGIGPHAAVGAGAHNQVRRKLVQDLNQVVEHQRVAIFAPLVPYHPVGQDDEVLGLLAPIDDNPPELILVDPRHLMLTAHPLRPIATGLTATIRRLDSNTLHLVNPDRYVMELARRSPRPNRVRAGA